MNAKSIARVVVFGEVLWDCFPDRRVMGGAPFNVAWNLAGFGVDPFMISAVGDDDLGHEILRKMQLWNMSVAGITVHDELATGTVQVSLDEGEPSYEITTGVAYDAIAEPKLSGEEAGFLYHGSLIWRSPRNRETLLKLRKELGAKVFVDVNIREPHFDIDWVEPMLRDVYCVKLNVGELAQISGKSTDTDEQRHEAARDLLNNFGIDQVYVTRGSSGADWMSRDGGLVSVEAPEPKKWVDAVGAGDAFASVVLYGQLFGQQPERSLRAAVQFASEVCGLSGATTEQREFYHRSFLL